MIEKKYYVSELTSLNYYQIQHKLKLSSFEQWYSVLSNRKEYLLLVEKIGSNYPDLKKMFFDIDYHSQLIYPIDIVKLDNEFMLFNKLGYVYPKDIFEVLTAYTDYVFNSKSSHITFFEKLFDLISDLHNKDIFIHGFDKRQIFINNDAIKIRYISQEFQPQNSIYRIPVYEQENIKKNALDFFSLYVLTFEFMFQWHPYFGKATDYNLDEDSLVYHYDQAPVFIFDQENTMNEIGFFASHDSVIKKWESTDITIKRIFDNMFTIKNIVNDEQILREDYLKILYYLKNDK